MSDSNPAFASVVAAVFEEWTAKVAATIRAGQENGQICADFPAADLARLVVATIEGGIMLSRLTKHDGPFKACLTTLRAMLVASVAPAEPATSPQTQQGPRCGSSCVSHVHACRRQEQVVQ